MLTLRSRAAFSTLLDAKTLTELDAKVPAIIFIATNADPIHVSRQEFFNSAQRYATILLSMHIGPGDLVIIAHTQNLESIFAFWGAILIGAIPSMFPTLTEKLDPDIYMRELGELVKRSDVKSILTTEDFAKSLSNKVACKVYGSRNLSVTPDVTTLFTPSQPESTAFLQHSSGTTGLQKGVALSHKAVLNQLAAYGDALKLSADDSIVSWLPLYHDMGLIAGFIQPLVQGIPLILMSPFDWVKHPALLFRAIHEYHATLCWLPNFAYNHSARTIRKRDSEGLDLSSIRAFINCSEPVRDESHRLFAERFRDNGVSETQFTVCYAMAENTFAVTQTRPGAILNIDLVDRKILLLEQRAVPTQDRATGDSIVSCGKPIHGTLVKVVDEDGTSLGDRTIGEILIKSNCMLSNYYHREDLQPFDEARWYKTGDRGYIADGEIYIIGRSKDIIIHAGKNIYPQDIEYLVNLVDGVHPGRAVAFGVSDEREGTELITVVAEVDPGKGITSKQIAQAIRHTVGSQGDIVLNFVTLVEKGWLIKTSSGKIARAKNRDKWLAERKSLSV